MKQNNLNIDDITMDANDLEGSMMAVRKYVDVFLCDPKKITRDDLSALSGLMVSIQLLATKHADELSEFGMGI